MDETNDIIIGREKEQMLIQEYYDSPKAELVAIYGRRRVGKTYLIKSFFNQQFDFYFTGAFETPKATLLRLFQTQLERYKIGSRHLNNYETTCHHLTRSALSYS